MAIEKIYICDRAHANLALHARTATEHVRVSTLRHGEHVLDLCPTHFDTLMRSLAAKNSVSARARLNGTRPTRVSSGGSKKGSKWGKDRRPTKRMIETQKRVAQIVKFVEKASFPVSLSEISQATRVPKRLLHYDVSLLTNSGRIIAHGETASRRYTTPKHKTEINDKKPTKEMARHDK